MRFLVGTDLRGYFGLRGSDSVFGRRNVTEVRTLRVRSPNGPLITFVCTFLALITAIALAFADPFCNLPAPGLEPFFPANAFTFGATLALGFLPAGVLDVFALASFALGLAAVPATFLVTAFFSPTFLASVGFLVAAAFLSVAGFFAPAVAGFFAAGFLSSVAGRFAAGFAADAGFLSVAGLAAAGFFQQLA